MNRRSFLRSAAIPAVTAASYRRIYGANDRLGLGLIGAGRRGSLVAAAFQQDGRVDLRSICDVYDVHRERAKASLKANGARLIAAHEDVLSDPNIQAVLIATPDHLHLSLAEAALGARKHVYLEKPTIHRWSERIALEKAARESGTVLQCGTQQRSGAHYQQAKESIFDRNKLGQVIFARAVWSNFPWQQRHIVGEPKPAGLDWQRFLGPAPAVPYETVRYDSWRYFPDYGGGLLADILTHWADVAQWMLNDAKPVSAVAFGGIYAYADGRQNPDSVNAIVQYDRWNLSFESSVTPVASERPSVFFEGTEGTLDLARDGYTWQPNKGSAVRVDSAGSLERAHAKSFLDAVFLKQPVSAPLSTGIDASRPVQMALKAYWESRVVKGAEFTS